MNNQISMRFQGCCFIALCVLSQPVLSHTQPDAWMMTGGVGQVFFDDNNNLKTTPIYQLAIGYQADPVWAGEVMLGYFQTRSKQNQKEASGYHFNLNGLYHFQPSDPFNPYLIAGIGLQFAEKLTWPEDGASLQKSAVTFNGGFGIKYDISPLWQLRTELREFIVRHSIDYDFDTVVSISLTRHFETANRKRIRLLKPTPLESESLFPALRLADNISS